MKEEMKESKKITLVLVGALQQVLVGGVIFGWSMLDRGILIAPLEEGGANLTSNESAQLFSMASSISYMATLVIGIIMDRYGPRISSCLAHLFILVGFASFACSTEFHQFQVSIALLGFGGPGVGSAVLHIANLFDSKRYLVTALLCGSASVSLIIFCLFDFIWRNSQGSISFRNLFGCYAIVVLFSFLISLFVWPDTPFPIEEKPSPSLPSSKMANFYPSSPVLTSPVFEDKKLVCSKLTLREQITSKAFLKIVCIFIFTTFMCNFYIGSFTTSIADLNAYSQKEQHELALTLSFTMSMGGLVASFFVGSLLDQVGLILGRFFTFSLGICHFFILLKLATIKAWLVVDFAVYILFRQISFALFFGSIPVELGYTYFGLLQGIGFCLAGASQSLIAPLLAFVSGDCHEVTSAAECNDNWFQFHLIQVLIFSFLMLIPYFEYRQITAEKHKMHFISKVPYPDEIQKLNVQATAGHSYNSLDRLQVI